MGWAGVKNGSLMKLAEDAFDIFVTVDRNLSFQQNLSNYNIAVIVLRSVSNRHQDLAPFGPKVRDPIPHIKPRSAMALELEPRRGNRT